MQYSPWQQHRSVSSTVLSLVSYVHVLAFTELVNILNLIVFDKDFFNYLTTKISTGFKILNE